jgi:hypothetical protein
MKRKWELGAAVGGIVAGIIVSAVSIASSQPAASTDTVTKVADFGDNIVLPIDHVGSYEWVSEPVTPTSSPDAYVVEPRFINADVQNTLVVPEDTSQGTVLKYTFDVTSFSPGAEVLLIHVHADSSAADASPFPTDSPVPTTGATLQPPLLQGK